MTKSWNKTQMIGACPSFGQTSDLKIKAKITVSGVSHYFHIFLIAFGIESHPAVAKDFFGINNRSLS